MLLFGFKNKVNVKRNIISGAYSGKKFNYIDELELYFSHVESIKNIFSCNRNIVLFSGSEILEPRTDGAHFFYSCAYFAYVCCHNSPNCFVIIRGDKVKPILWIPGIKSFWEQSDVVDKCVEEIFDVKEYYMSVDEFIQSLNDCDIICDSKYASLFEYIFEIGNITINNLNVLETFNRKRSIKTEYEIHCISESTRIAFLGFNVIRILLEKKIWLSEKEIAHDFMKSVNGADNVLPYRPIVAFNTHSSYLHYRNYSNDYIYLKDKYSILVDAGVFYRGYACDITVTTTNDNFFKIICDVVSEIRDKIILSIKPGITFMQIQQYTHKLIAEGLFKIGIFNLRWCSVDDLIKEEVIKVFFPHGFGHAIGVQVHDVNYNKHNGAGVRNSGELLIGMVITVEPGIYFIPMLLEKFYTSSFFSNFKKDACNIDLINAYLKFGGVRQEHNVLITKDGCLDITKSVFNEFDIV